MIDKIKFIKMKCLKKKISFDRFNSCKFLPFSKSCNETKNSKNIIENIDIGGPTMVRAAAKNFKNVAIITNKNDYQQLN